MTEPVPTTEMTEVERLHAAIANVLVNASNYPARAQARMLGQDTQPLTEMVRDAVLAAGFRHEGERLRSDAVSKTGLTVVGNLLVTVGENEPIRVVTFDIPIKATVEFTPLGAVPLQVGHLNVSIARSLGEALRDVAVEIEGRQL